MNHKTRYILLEDEYYTAEDLKRMIRQMRPDYELVGQTDTADEARQLLRQTEADLVISDVQLSDNISLPVLRAEGRRLPVIVFTGYKEYAAQLQGINAVDFVLKPVSESDLNQSLSKYESLAMQ